MSFVTHGCVILSAQIYHSFFMNTYSFKQVLFLLFLSTMLGALHNELWCNSFYLKQLEESNFLCNESFPQVLTEVENFSTQECRFEAVLEPQVKVFKLLELVSGHGDSRENSTSEITSPNELCTYPLLMQSSLRAMLNAHSGSAFKSNDLKSLHQSVESLRLGDVEVDSSQSERDTIPSSMYLWAGAPRVLVDGSPARLTSKIRPYTLAAIGLAYTGAIYALHVYQKQTLWNQRGDFHFMEDGNYADWVDKFGHGYGAYTMSYYSGEVLRGAGVQAEAAQWYGSLLGLAYQLYIEVEDGYARDWGFSPSDAYSNTAGAAYHLLQWYVPVLQNFTPKWLYTPASSIGEKSRLFGSNFNDDYSSSTFYLSAKVYNLLPTSAQKYWVPWLNVGVGYATRALNLPEQDRKYIVMLDYDLVEMLPDFRVSPGGLTGDVLNWLKQSLNLFKLPSPALEIGQHGVTRFNLLYPFKIELAGIKF